MTDRPIIFSGPMVRALLERQKFQTRRLITSPLAKCQPGDRLWVRESFLDIRPFRQAPLFAAVAADAVYMADGAPIGCHNWKPSIHMPRWASRLTLPVAEVRFQRLQDISEQDAIAEGLRRVTDGLYHYWRVDEWNGEGSPGWSTARAAFAALWDSLHGKKSGESWADNPEIAGITFDPRRGNIDQMESEGLSMTRRNIQDVVDAIGRLEDETRSMLAAHCAAMDEEIAATRQVRRLEAFIAGDVGGLAARPQPEHYRDHLQKRLADNRAQLVKARSVLDHCHRDARQRLDRLACIEVELASWRFLAARLKAESPET